MSESDHATHKHKRLGEVMVLHLTAELAQVVTLTTRERLWVKRTDLSALAEKTEPIRPGKKRRSA
jgi:hypothetical protein